MRRFRSFALWLVAALVGAVFVAAGLGKLAAPQSTERVMDFVGATPLLTRAVLICLPGVEMALGVALVLHWRSVVAYSAAISLLILFSVFLLVLAKTDYTAKCACFGSLVNAWSGGGPLVGVARNATLVGLLAWPSLDAIKHRAKAVRASRAQGESSCDS